jgi:hypothetical protein
MPPKSERITWQEWKRQLKLKNEELNETSSQKGKVSNPNGRLIVKIHQKKGKGAKWLEAYWLLCAIDLYRKIRA